MSRPPTGPLDLPPWGLAEEILADLGWAPDEQGAAPIDPAAAPPPQQPPAPPAGVPPSPVPSQPLQASRSLQPSQPAESPQSPSSPSQPLTLLPAPSPPALPSSADGERLYSFVDAFARRGDEATAPREQAESWVIFELAGERYGLPVDAVQEILRVGTVTRVPHSPSPVRGITNLRGRVLAVVDLRVRLGLPPAPIDDRSRILVADSRQRTIGLLVDAAVQVVKLLPSSLAAAPPDVMTAGSDYIAGVYHLGDQLIVALALDRVLLVPDAAATSPGTRQAREARGGGDEDAAGGAR